MSDNNEPQGQVDMYLAALRQQLAGLPAEDVEETLTELRGHIAERARESGAPMEQVLRQLGAPEEIGALYRADALVAIARAGFSPALIIHATMRLATRTGVGFAAFLVGLVGYMLGSGLIICAILKPFLPTYVGLWINSQSVVLGAAIPRPHGPELLGWWLIPYGLGLGVAFFIGTTVFLRWMLRFVPKKTRRRVAATAALAA